MMKECKKVIKEISLYGSVISDDCLSHAESCPSCKKNAESQKQIDSLFTDAGKMPAPPEFTSIVLQRADLLKIGRPTPPMIKYLLTTFGTAILIVFGFLLGMSSVSTKKSGIAVKSFRSKSSTFNILVESVPIENLSNIYFNIMKGVSNDQ